MRQIESLEIIESKIKTRKVFLSGQLNSWSYRLYDLILDLILDF